MKAIVLAFMMAQAAAAAPVPEIPQEAIEEPAPVYEYMGDYRVTAYAYYEGGGENYQTAGGYTPVPYYTVATNEEFDLGTILYIEGIGEVQVQDRGGFPEGIIDLHIGDDPMSSFDDRVRKVYVVRR
jgi:3D (Asp-Asp-Asp) domain-containing protein